MLYCNVQAGHLWLCTWDYWSLNKWSMNLGHHPSLPLRSHWGPRLGWPSCVTRGIDPGLLITWLHWKLTSTINIDLAAISSGESDINLSLPAQSVRRRERRLKWRERKWWWWWWWWWSWGKWFLGNDVVLSLVRLVQKDWCGSMLSEWFLKTDVVSG